MTENSSRRRVFALMGAVLLALFGAGTGVRDLLDGDEGPSENGLDLSVDYSVTPDPPESTPTPTSGNGGGADGTADPTDGSSSGGVAAPGTSDGGRSTPTGDDDPWFLDDEDDDAGDGGPTTAASGPSGDLVSSSVPPVSLTGLSPGDGGVVDLSLRLWGARGRLWVRADASNFAERSVVESERSAGDAGPPGELQEYVRVRLWYDADGDGSADGERVVYDGPLARLGTVDDWTALTDDCVPPGTHTVRFRWDVPTDAPSTIQTDAVDFSLGVAAEASDCR